MTEDISTLVQSNAKSIQALTDLVSRVVARVDTLAEQQYTFSRELIDLQRQSNNMQRHIDDLRADTRELMLENQRILRYLERRENQS